MHAAHLGDRRRPVLRGRRVLLVEDEALVAMLLDEWLLEAGGEVVGPAGSVDEALALIDRAWWDGDGLSAAVLDIDLRGELVWPVADRLAALGVPFVFVTGYGDACMRGVHTAAPLLVKPFGPGALVTALEGSAADG